MAKGGREVETPTIILVSLKPFCPACDGGLHVQGHDEITTTWVEQEGTPPYPVEVFVLICSWCGKMLEPSDVIWRERDQNVD